MDIRDEIIHYCNMAAGCESINSVLANGGKLTYEGRYAQAVLRLHAEDAGLIAGTESFLDSFKKGAENVKDWVTKLIKAIRDFITGKKKERPELPKTSSKPKEDTGTKKTNSGEKYAAPIKSFIAKAEKTEGLTSIVSSLKGALSATTSGTAKDVGSKLRTVDDRILSEMSTRTNKLNQLASKDNAQAEINVELQAIKALGALSQQIDIVIERTFSENMS